MADMTPLDDILNDNPATAVPVQNNFQKIEGYINGSELLRTDGTKVMAADLDTDSNKVVNLADGSATGDAVHWGQVALGKVAYARGTENTLELSTAKKDIVGLSVTWTADPSRLYRISFAYHIVKFSGAAVEDAYGYVTDAADTAEAVFPLSLETAPAVGTFMFGAYAVSGLSGSVTRKVMNVMTGFTNYRSLSGTYTTYPSYLLVEDIGLA
jgi:hypothetical protein